MLRAIHSSMVGRIFSASKRLGEVPRRPARLYALDVLPVAERRQDNDTFGGPVRQNLSGHRSPSSSGIWMSSSATSGADARQALHRLHPVTGLAHHPISGEPQKVRKVWRTPSSSSARKMVVLPILVTPIRLSSRFYKKSILKRTKNASRCSPRI